MGAKDKSKVGKSANGKVLQDSRLLDQVNLYRMIILIHYS